MTTTISAEYIMGIKEGREAFKTYGGADAQDRISNIRSTLKGFSGSSPVGQMLRGELHFWLNQVKVQA